MSKKQTIKFSPISVSELDSVALFGSDNPSQEALSRRVQIVQASMRNKMFNKDRATGSPLVTYTHTDPNVGSSKFQRQSLNELRDLGLDGDDHTARVNEIAEESRAVLNLLQDGGIVVELQGTPAQIDRFESYYADPSFEPTEGFRLSDRKTV